MVRPYVWMLFGAFAFATMSAFVHELGGKLGWQIIAVVRAAIPLILSGCLARMAGVQLVMWRPWTLWWRSLSGSCSLVFAFFALTRSTLPVAHVVTITNLFPLWIAILSWPFLGQLPPARVWIAIGIGLIGVGLIQQPHLMEGEFGIVAALISSLFSALAMLGLHRLKEIDPRAIVFHFSLVAFLICLVALFVSPNGVEFPSITGQTVLSLSLLGLFATIGQILLTKAFTLGNPAKVSVVGLSQVGFGMAYDWWFWGRVFNPAALAGIVLVLAPVSWLLWTSRST